MTKRVPLTFEDMRDRLTIVGDIVSPIDEWGAENEPLRGSVLHEGDIVSPLDEEWEADRDPEPPPSDTSGD